MLIFIDVYGAENLRRKGAVSEAIAAYLNLRTCEDVKYRLLAADGLVKCKALADAASLYEAIYITSTDIDWKILAASGLADCGASNKLKAIVRLMQINISALATELQKVEAKCYLIEFSESLTKNK
jgi:hypothetical protein